TGADDHALRLAAALKILIAAVKLQPSPLSNLAQTNEIPASVLLAESYYQQSRMNLNEALASARSAVARAPDFAFGWARMAELELSFGRIDDALKAIDHALEL